MSYTIETVASVVGHVKSDRLKVYGVTTARRSAALPDAPPLAEAADLPGFDAAAWIGYLTLGMETAANSPEELGALMRSEQERYAAIIRTADIKIEN